jgi:hypothetical protein
MKIDLERSGGFAGITKRITIDTIDLPEDIRTKLETFFSQSIDLHKQRIMGKKNKTPDCYSYKMSGHKGNSTQEVVFGEFEVDKALKSAINYLFKIYKD